jgi:DNA modification methylase
LEEKVFSDRNPELASADMPQNRSGNAKQNFHPTVKPIALMEYLIKMVTPKGGTVLDPFMGSGSTGVAAKKNGYDFIGIDMTQEYIEIAKARINHYEDPSD